ncbi:MAG: branched-chain amino acid ABC transporter permease [Candidatus Atribacteria bacterium]|nr:branched-chain amino acid ABC transporter permease [Candidatus Atribacteria bacterium]
MALRSGEENMLFNRESIVKNRIFLAFFLFVLVFIVLPIVIEEAYIIHIIILCLMYSVVAGSWNLLIGYTGIFSFGHQAFFGIGAYVSAIISMRLGISPWLGLLIGGAVAACVGSVVAIPCLKLRAAPYVAIATLCMAEMCRIAAQNLISLTRGESGLWGIPEFPSIGVISFLGSRTPYYYLILGLFVLIFGIIYWVLKSPLSLALQAIRESQDAAESLGINITSIKILVFVISAFFAGVMGSFYAHYILILTPSSVFNMDFMVVIIAMTFIGGVGTFFGPIIGAFFLTISMELLRVIEDSYRLMFYGVLLVLVIIFLPKGLVNLRFRTKRISPSRIN